MNSKFPIKIFRTDQVREIDSYTIQNEPISSINLMERAALAVYSWINEHYSKSVPVKVFAGTGNNGGDGLAVARMLAEDGFSVTTYLIKFSDKTSEDHKVNLSRLQNQNKVVIEEISNENEFPVISKSALVVDAIFGSGLTRSLSGPYASIVKHLNMSGAGIISIDIPSGLMGESNTENKDDSIIRANFTLSFQFPKLSFLFYENETFTGNWEVLPIGLHPAIIQKTETPYYFVTKNYIQTNRARRKKFSHKGSFGHALLISGCYGKMGAAVLASRACLSSGVGLLTTHVPRMGNDIMQISVPEAMISLDQSDILFSQPPDLSEFSSVGIGPALGCRNNSQHGLHQLIQNAKRPLVLDADAINILAQNQDWLSELPENSILTPHPKEFERLTQKAGSGYERHLLQIEFAVKHKVIVVLKGAFTSITCPDGRCYFNSTGNPGMATAGSGDVLTGIILSLLSQGYEPQLAAIIGVYIHGAAGDIAMEILGEEALIASDIIDNLGNAFLSLNE